METNYEILLRKAYEKVKIVSLGSDRFEIPKVKGLVEGKNTIITNITTIASYLRRPVEQLIKFLQKELAASGRLDNDRFIINARLNSDKVNEKIELYAKNFVICTECGKPDSEIVTEKGIKFKHCLACGAKSPVKYEM